MNAYVVNYCLSRSPDWMTASKGVLASLKYDHNQSIDKITIALREAFDSASLSDPANSENILTKVINDQTDKKIKGYLKQICGEYISLYDKSEAQKIQLSAVNDNRRLLKPINGIGYHKVSQTTFDQANICSQFLLSKHKEPNKLLIEVDSILNDLFFKPKSSNKFEEAMKNIASFIGFEGQRPEDEFNRGPDILWSLGQLEYIVIECKNEATTDTICKHDCNQLNGSANWFESQYDKTCKYTPILIHPSTTFEYATSPNLNIRIINQEKLELFKNSVHSFIVSICTNNELANVSVIRQKLIQYKLISSDFLQLYSTNYSRKK